MNKTEPCSICDDGINHKIKLLSTHFGFDYADALQIIQSPAEYDCIIPSQVPAPTPTSSSNIVFKRILDKCRTNKTLKTMLCSSLKTTLGHTQASERSYISVIENIIKEMGLTYSKAGSQQPYDFRVRLPGHEQFNPSEKDIRSNNLMHNGECGMLLLECKKTDTTKMMCNDTAPSHHMFYLIMGTEKQKKRIKTPAFILGVNGYEVIQYSPWLKRYIKEVDLLKNKYKKRGGCVSVYTRPNISVNIQSLLEKYYTESVVHNPTIINAPKQFQ